MADPYNPYTSYSTPTPGGVGYYPPEDQTHFQQQQQHPGYQPQQPYGHAEPQANPHYGYAPHPSASPNPYHLAPEPYQGGAQERSYTPVGQPDYLGPVTSSGTPSGNEGRVPENLGYYGHPADQPRYTPSASPHPPSVHVSDADRQNYRGDENRPSDQDGDAEGERGIGSSLAGGAAGYYFGHKKNHGLLGAIGGAIMDIIMSMGVDIITITIIMVIVGVGVTHGTEGRMIIEWDYDSEIGRFGEVCKGGYTCDG